MSARALKEVCCLDKATLDFVELTAGSWRFSPRSLDRLLRVARTIADMDGRAAVGREQVEEAMHYRLRSAEPDKAV